MPFTSTTTLPPNPVVRILFSGQLILQSPRDKKICEVSINRSAPDHVLSVEVRGKKDNVPDVVLMRHFGPLSFTTLAEQPARTHGMYIRLGAGGSAGVMRYDGGRVGAASALGDALNLVTLHDTANPRPSLKIDERAGRPSISIDGGVFYTALKTARKFKLTKPNAGTTDESNFASLIGAAIEGNAEMIWTQNGLRVNLALRPDDRFQRFEIYVTNDPLYEDEEDGSAPPHDEFDEYYKMLPGVQSHQKCTLKQELQPAVTSPPDLPDSAAERGSNRTPCMPVVIDPAES
ncbi:MAG TPA: hypothetical protein VF591_07280 [Pyrinomonadaceae bacterium]|jgi:hypothetical protein